ncbi:acetyltransferase [Seminavis robusta]|uniref:Acetyltransferase n=1 Tax=Seminavis robusta TaxID=568900 RepID=A0A9N8H8S1_9STRA|nr:acetyltransferase [Seminavis robusta]|eukprot:Sro179_g078460.1 acetyltransferase (687) ;mRNA; r:33613-35673
MTTSIEYMKQIQGLEVNEAQWVGDDAVLEEVCRHWKECCKSAGYNAEDEEWNRKMQEFHQENQKSGLRPRTFVATAADSGVVGSINCQIWAGPLPWIVQPDVFRLGSVWGLHVDETAKEPEAVRRELLKAALDHLRSAQCSKVVTLAFTKNDRDALIEANVGFQSANMLTLDLQSFEEVETTAPESYTCIPGDESYDAMVCENWRKMWQDVGIPAKALISEMEEVTLSFLKQARDRLRYQTFVARDDATNEVVASVSCQVWEGPMPTNMISKFQLGTIWAVYVDPSHRRRGVATCLMKLALQHLQKVGCDNGILIAASEGGQRVYERLGFRPNNALVCDVNPAAEKSTAEEPAKERRHVEEEKKQEDTSVAGKPSKARVPIWDRQRELVGLLKERDMTPRQLNAMATATTRQVFAVYGDNPRVYDVATAVKNFQRRHGMYVDPECNWFTQNVTKFGRGFDMKKLKEDPTKLASKFDRLSIHYDDWTVGNQSKVESFIVECARNHEKVMKSKAARILDVACGIGLQGQVLRLCGFEGELVGTDISQGMVQRVMERGCYDHAYVANANESLACSDDGRDGVLYDAVICTGAMELLDQCKVLADLARMTKPCGEVWVSFQQYTLENPTEHQNVRGTSEADALNLLKQAGFDDIVSMERCRDAFYTPSPSQDGSLLPVPYLFLVARKSSA